MIGTADTAVTLTTSYSDNISSSVLMQYNSQLTFFVDYTTGAGGAGNSVQIQVEGSPDLLDNHGVLPNETLITPIFYIETSSNTSGGTITHTQCFHTLVGTSSATEYRSYFFVPPAYKTIRISVKETVVGGSAGSLKVRMMKSGA